MTVWPLLPAAAVLAAALLYGHLRMAGNVTGPGPRIALVQGSIDVKMRYDKDMRGQVFQQYYDLSREAVAKEPRPDLVVWPESMFVTPLVNFAADAQPPPEFDRGPADFRKELQQGVRNSASDREWLARSLGVPLLLGVDGLYFGGEGERVYNAAAYVDRDGRLLGRYDKMHLVPFGEYVPFADYWPWLKRLTPLPISVTAGSEPAAFELHPAGNPKDVCRIAPNICYETVLPQVIRRQVHTLAAQGREPDILVNLTNDGWFWGSSELDMHLVCAVFRAVECRKPLLVAANTGFSAWIDSDGNILRQGPRRETRVIFAHPSLDHRRSWYLAHGDWPAGVCLAACGLFAAVGLYGRVRRNRCH
jgi:apolipoprotein N-acyltransferase